MLKEIKYIDIHGHVNFPNFDADRETIIENAGKAGVAMITVGTDIATSTSAVQLATMHEQIWATIGVHPTDSKECASANVASLLRHICDGRFPNI